MRVNKAIKKIIFSVLIVYFSIVAGLYLAQRSMIYFPPKVTLDIAPYVAQGVFETQTVTKDGINLTGWMRNPDLDKPTIVFFHGNASSVGYSIYKAAPYAGAGYGFLLAGYRGYDENEGKPSEQGFYADARAWIQKLKAFGVPEDKIILYGESIGTGVAVQMATEFPDVRAVILEAPYTSLPDVAAKTYFFIPVHLLMKDKFDNLSKIKDVRAPIFIMQGLKDNVISPALGQKLFEKANDPKEILQLKDYGHSNIPNEVKAPAVINFLEKYD